MKNASSATPVDCIVIVPMSFVYDRLVCEFTHWDQCLTGLIRLHSAYWFCQMLGDYHGKRYGISKVRWTDECEEYLADYRATYHHWFYVNGRREAYDGRPIGKLFEKWANRNPIREQSQ